VGAGDIGWCGSPGPEETARLLDGIGGTVFTTGDLAYPSGTREEFLRCYDPSWGRHKGRTRPTPGNHEYVTAGAAAYFEYFGALAGPSGLGYYSFDLGEWHAVSLNSNIPADSRSAQASWLRADLAATSSRCVVAYWHHPLFTSGPNGAQGHVRDLWRILYEANVELVLNGHDHLYERFAPQDPEGRPDPVRGIRQFIIGTGGARPYTVVNTSGNSERRIDNVFGVLKLTLSGGSYEWEFIPVSGGHDTGMGSCH
jgi:3',5'-cyclic AMP phosphodiesterase CpdA